MSKPISISTIGFCGILVIVLVGSAYLLGLMIQRAHQSPEEVIFNQAAVDDKATCEIHSDGLITLSHPDLRVSAADLVSDYSTDGVAASQKYSGKTLEVRGVVSSVQQDTAGSLHIIMAEPEDLDGPARVDAAVTPGNATFPESLTRSQHIAVICGEVITKSGTVMLNRCDVCSARQADTEWDESPTTPQSADP